jgi:hypothetical protein
MADYSIEPVEVDGEMHYRFHIDRAWYEFGPGNITKIHDVDYDITEEFLGDVWCGDTREFPPDDVLRIIIGEWYWAMINGKPLTFAEHAAEARTPGRVFGITVMPNEKGELFTEAAD